MIYEIYVYQLGISSYSVLPYTSAYVPTLVSNKTTFNVKAKTVIEQDENPIKCVIVNLVLVDLIKKFCWNLFLIQQMKITNTLQRLDDYFEITS